MYTQLAEIEVNMVDNVYNVDELEYVSICASHTGNIEGRINLNLDFTPGTADGKTRAQ